MKGCGGTIEGGGTAEGRDSGGCAARVAGVLGGISGWNGCAASLLEPRQAMQVVKTLLRRSAEASLRKEESGSFFTQEEQYFESRGMEGSRGKIDGRGGKMEGCGGTIEGGGTVEGRNPGR